ncbi:hypothetical protein [Hymenobacter koreensis]|uniref:Uncharacterized protein n=1 Tax=Hymenobacter koreensis TaxID=1084523 RepID=A0ABP8JJX3_9BACT
MRNPSWPVLFRAASERLAQFGQQLLAADASGAPTAAIEQAVLDLSFGLEEAAACADPAARSAVYGYLIETYGLLAQGPWPFAEPQLPGLPADGGVLDYRILYLNGSPVLLNTNLYAAAADVAPLS